MAIKPSTTLRQSLALAANDNTEPSDCRWRRLIDQFKMADLPTLAVHTAQQKLRGRDFDGYVNELLAAAGAHR